MQTTKQFRSAKTGKYTTKAKAKKSPATTVSESNKGFAAYKKKENERLAKMRAILADLRYDIEYMQSYLEEIRECYEHLYNLLS